MYKTSRSSSYCKAYHTSVEQSDLYRMPARKSFQSQMQRYCTCGPNLFDQKPFLTQTLQYVTSLKRNTSKWKTVDHQMTDQIRSHWQRYQLLWIKITWIIIRCWYIDPPMGKSDLMQLIKMSCVKTRWPEVIKVTATYSMNFMSECTLLFKACCHDNWLLKSYILPVSRIHCTKACWWHPCKYFRSVITD